MPARDPRWLRQLAALKRIYAQLDADEKVLSMALSTVDEEAGVLIVTAVDSDGVLTRKLISDPDIFEDAVRLAEDPRNVNLVPEVADGTA